MARTRGDNGGSDPEDAATLERIRQVLIRAVQRHCPPPLIDEIRRFRRQQRQAGQLSESEPGTPGPEARSEILDCLSSLQDRRRTAVTLHLQGFRTAEVATALGWTEKQAENLVYRGLADLRSCLEGEDR